MCEAHLKEVIFLSEDLRRLCGTVFVFSIIALAPTVAISAVAIAVGVRVGVRVTTGFLHLLKGVLLLLLLAP